MLSNPDSVVLGIDAIAKRIDAMLRAEGRSHRESNGAIRHERAATRRHLQHRVFLPFSDRRVWTPGRRHFALQARACGAL